MHHQLKPRCIKVQKVVPQAAGGPFSINDFCQWASIGRTAAYAELKAGRLSARKFGRRTLIAKSEAERWLGSLQSLGSIAI